MYCCPAPRNTPADTPCTQSKRKKRGIHGTTGSMTRRILSSEVNTRKIYSLPKYINTPAARAIGRPAAHG